ncbi:hypothetical protein D3C71_434800 [compost metagenome]
MFCKPSVIMNKLYTLLLLCLLSCCHPLLYAQGENNNWHFGKKQSINFNVSPPLQQESNMMSYEAAVAVSNAQGQLQFYTIGSRIWNRNGAEMPNSNGLLGNGPTIGGQPAGSSAYGAQVIKHPGNPNRYFVFSGDAQEDNSYNVYYSVVDMTLDGGNGDVVPGMKNIPIMTNGSEYMAVTRGADCKSYWLIVRTNAIWVRDYYAFKIDVNGVNTTPVITTPPAFMIGAFLPLIFGNDGTSMYSMGTGGIVFAQFNNVTGVVSGFQSFTAYSFGPMALSADNTKLYTAEGTAGVKQYDLTLMPNLTAVQNSAQIISPAPNPSHMTVFNDMRRGPDGKIYLLRQEISSSYYNVTIDCIPQPNVSGTAAGYNIGAFDYISSWSPPLGLNTFWRFGDDFIVSPEVDTIARPAKDTVVCFASSLNLQSPEADAAYYQWSNGATGSSASVSTDGLYWVYSTNNCQTYIDSFKVHFTRFTLDLPDDTALCENKTLQLDVTDPAIDAYLWNDGDANGVKAISQAGRYTVRASSGLCSLSDTITVSITHPKVDILQDDLSMCNNNISPITADANVPGSYYWNTGDTGRVLIPDHSGIYVVSHLNACGLYKDSIRVTINDCICKMMIPNVFTPNGDGRNDVFLPVTAPGCNFMFYDMRIYNRYGQLVYYTNNAANGWDGTFRDQPAEAGAYMYSIKYTNRYTDETAMENGDVILMR